MAQYVGGKNGSGTFQNIINHIPKHDVYFEGFAGSAAIYFNMLPAANSILCDVCSYQLSSLNTMVRPGTIVKNFDMVKKISVVVRFLNFLTSKGISVFAYFDPPYLFDVRSSKNKIYKHEIYTADHIALLTDLSCAKFNCMISCYRSPLYSSMLEHWNSFDFQSITRKGLKTETIYFNYSPPSILQDYRYIGNNFRKREAFARAKKNFISKLNSFDPLLRNSILNDLQ